MSFNKVMFSSLSDHWNTPRSLYEKLDAEFNFDFDPCPPQSVFDGLTCKWGKRNYVNPPYSQIAKWCAKCFEEFRGGNLVVMLIPSRTDTRYWHDFIMKATEIRFIKGRLRFNDQKNSAPFPSCIVVFDPNKKEELSNDH